MHNQLTDLASIERAHRHADDTFICAERAEKAALSGRPGVAARHATEAIMHFFICRRSQVADAARKSGRRASAACDAVQMAFSHAGSYQMADEWQRRADEIARLSEQFKGDE